jgi:transposase-like protein
MFAAEIRKKRVERMRAHTHWRWHLDEMFVKAAVDHEGEVLESFATKQRDMAAALKVPIRRRPRCVDRGVEDAIKALMVWRDCTLR